MRVLTSARFNLFSQHDRWSFLNYYHLPPIPFPLHPHHMFSSLSPSKHRKWGQMHSGELSRYSILTLTYEMQIPRLFCNGFELRIPSSISLTPLLIPPSPLPLPNHFLWFCAQVRFYHLGKRWIGEIIDWPPGSPSYLVISSTILLYEKCQFRTQEKFF